MDVVSARRVIVAAALACLSCSIAALPAHAGVNFTSGKVYVQQKVWDKACYFLELARREEPENVQVYALLAVARAQRRQYLSAGAAFSIGIKLGAEKKDSKRLKEMEQNRGAVMAQLYNDGLRALNKAGSITPDANRTTGDESSPQGGVEKERGSPRDFGRFVEGGQVHEFWYYTDAGIGFHFAPNMNEARQFEYRPYTGAPDPQKAVTDTTIYLVFEGASRVEEAAYNFMLASYVEPSASDTYKNLSYVFEVLGRADDAMTAARMGLALKPDDEQLKRNLRAAAIGRANRLFNAEKYADAILAYRTAAANDTSSRIVCLSQIADSWYRVADKTPKGPARAATFDSAASAYMTLLNVAPAESTLIRENALYNSAIIYSNLENHKEAVKILDQAVTLFPANKEFLSLAGQTKYSAGDYQGSVDALRKALALDPADPTVHQFLFLSLNKLSRREESVAEYTVYKALSEGRARTGTALKTWVDSADNRLGAGHQLKKTVADEGYPEEVRTFSEGEKTLESWFYWSKGKAITFMDGRSFSLATFPPKKS
jgi:tetratricopeptide (TPR) repeat protein